MKLNYSEDYIFYYDMNHNNYFFEFLFSLSDYSVTKHDGLLLGADEYILSHHNHDLMLYGCLDSPLSRSFLYE